MSLFSIAYKNIRKSLTFYSLYLFSIAFILTIFFCFVSFSMNDVMLEKISEDGRVEMMTRAIAIFLMAFVVFYMSYSNKFFIKKRTRELGIYTLLGYRKSTMLKLLTFENIIICLGAFIIGLLLGAMMHKGIIAGIVKLLGLNINQSNIPLFNAEAILYSFIFVIMVIFSLCLSNWRLLRRSTVINLVRLDKIGEKRVKTRMPLAILGFIIMILGDVLAISAVLGKDSLWFIVGFAPIGLLVVICITLGTSLFIYFFIPYIVKQIQNRERILYTPTGIITIPKIIHRIRTNAKALVLLSLISAGTLGIFAASVLTAYYPVASVKRIIPSAIEFRLENTEQGEQTIQALDDAIGIASFQAKTTNLLIVTATSDELPTEYSISEDEGREPGFEIISFTDYMELLEQQDRKISIDNLEPDESILIKYRPDSSKSDIGNSYALNLTEGKNIKVIVKDTTLSNPIGFSNSVGTLIVSDLVYEQLKNAQLPVIQIMSIDGNGLRDSKTAYEAVQPILQDNIYFASAYARIYEIIYLNSSTFLLLGFLTVLFFIAAGTILHFHNISAITYDIDDYDILSKMGYNQKRIKRIVRNQILAIYSVPFLLGLVHACCGMFCYKSLLMDDILGESSQVILPVMLAMTFSVVIYSVYFFITKRSGYRILLKP